VALALALALMLVGAGAMVLAEALTAPPQPQRLGANMPINDSADVPMDLSAHNSPVVARNPTDASNVVVANRLDNPDYGCALHVSSDAAASFSPTRLPVPEPDASECFAPDVAFGPDGTLYVLFTTLRGRGNRPHAVWLATSDDGGQTLSRPTRVLGELSFQTDLAVDPQHAGRVYLTWLDAEATATFAFPETGYPIRFTASDDGGDTWSEPVTVSGESRQRVVAPSLAVGAGGRLHLLYLDLGGDRLDWSGAHQGRGGPPYPGVWQLVAARSRDGGASWREMPVGEVRPPERIVVFMPDVPALAVDRDRGRVYAAFHARSGGDADVWLWRSDDGAATWKDPVRVNDTLADDGTAQYLPQVDVASTGRVDVVYYDRRGDDANVMNEVSLASSRDGGASFSQRLVLSDQAFDSRIGFGGFRGLADLGSRLGLLSTRGRALTVWADTRAGSQATEKQDVVRQAVAFAGLPTPAPAVRAGLRYGGGALVVLGGSLAIGWSWRRRRTRLQEGEVGDHRSVAHVTDEGGATEGTAPVRAEVPTGNGGRESGT